ncbi:MAG: hypothetical protein LHV68_06480 [Elusimicrobia bacterium]|nr:hypothetical protein [Candidatus Liberimonas magnetica]
MNVHIVRAEALVSAIRTLPKQEKKIILEELITDMEKDFSKEEWFKIEKLADKKSRVYKDSDSFLKALAKL